MSLQKDILTVFKCTCIEKKWTTKPTTAVKDSAQKHNGPFSKNYSIKIYSCVFMI